MLENKVALVTGGSKGIGLATAQLFAKEGASIIITGRNQEDLLAARDLIQGDVLAIQSDTSSMQDVQILFEQIKNRYQKIDPLFINAGMAEGGEIGTVTEDTFDRHINTNFKGAFFTAQESLPYLNSKASIIFVASVAATMGIQGLSIYSSTKAALVSLSKTLAADLAPRSIRVNTISPGYIATPLGMRNNKEKYDEICQTIPFEHRFGTAEEVAQVALFLASEMASYVTATDLVVDGGLSSITPVFR